MARGRKASKGEKDAGNLLAGANMEAYQHPEASLLARPEIGSQARFKKKKPKATYRYDSSLAPEMNWDGQNPAREHGEWLIACIEEAAKLKESDPPFTFKEPREFRSADGRIVATVRSLADATAQVKALSRPFLNWSGKAERLTFDVPTLPLFVHERLSTQAIVETLKSHRKDAAQADMFDLFGDPKRSLADAITRAYEHQDKWVNRLILGDSLGVMNSLLRYEGMGEQVQMVYIDPPYGVKFGSNFQPFVRKREVSAGDDEDFTREPETVKAYRDTWTLGLHSYMSYLRERILLARDLLHPSGSIFVQISDDNLHQVRELLDQIFGAENSCAIILMRKSGWAESKLLPSIHDFILWYAKDKQKVKYHQLYIAKELKDAGEVQGAWLEAPDGESDRPLSSKERENPLLIPEGWKLFFHDNLTSAGNSKYSSGPIEFKGKTYWPGVGQRTDRHWKTHPEGMQRLIAANRVMAIGDTLRQKRYFSDFPFSPVADHWDDTAISGFSEDKLYVVQTNPKAAERCILMTTDPGDLILDPTCGGGTLAYCAEQWGRRWITIDTSRVPLALTRQRLLSGTFSYFNLQDEARGPSGGFIYCRRKNRKGEEVGGIVPHVMLKNIANNQPAKEEILTDHPEINSSITRVSGPFCVEATIPTPLDLDGDGEPDDGSDSEERTSFVERMLDTLRRAPILQLGQGRTVMLNNIRPPAKTLALSAEAVVDATSEGQKATLADTVVAADEKNRLALPLSQRPVAIVFGPENGAVSERLVDEAARESSAKRYTHLYVIGFAIQPNAENLINQADAIYDVPATFVPVTPDVVMGDLLKTTRASQIFSVAGRPEIEIQRLARRLRGTRRVGKSDCLAWTRSTRLRWKSRHGSRATTCRAGCSMLTTTAASSWGRRCSFRAQARGKISRRH